MKKVSRRKFLKDTAIISTIAPLAMSSAFRTEQEQFKLGYQLYSIRDFMEKDPLGTLKKLKSFGYSDFETYGLDAEKLSYYGYTAQEFKSILDDLGLSTSSGHYGFPDYLTESVDKLKYYTDRCIAGAKALDQDFITWPWLPPEYRDKESYKKLISMLNIIGSQVKNAGLSFAYHNHGFDLEDLGDGEIGYEMIRKETDPSLVKLQLDMYWAVYAGLDPVEMIAKEPDRYVMWHIKDMDKKTRDYSELGNGSIDYARILANASRSGLKYYFIEQGGNYAKNSMKSAETSAIFFQKNLKQLLG